MTTATEPARRGRPGYDRDSMLEVVVEAFNERGYDATSLGVLAERLGLSKSAIYHHFASKEQMLEVALGKALDALEAVFDAPEATSGPVVDRIRHVIRGAVLVLCEHRAFVTLLLRLRGNTPIELEALRRRREIDRKLRAMFEQSRAEGTLRPDIDPRVAERLTFGMVNSIVEWYRPDGPITPHQLADSVLELVRTGLREPSSL
ncbi:TetR/AcrR family transcriptional regulator [Agrococcus sp. BE272]|uniref:TetR/AcrR family transcriptional regulator n=1 Tax=Agrococcus sp. BE272 TaxID=2817727 RepID=UPI002862CD5B|nr:TetR/AcrR family transcriptional regulator [Agrococcus sp. BE272]MDR7233949.1 AcrR family transcriptional regulator [Agrococcus sp. BE272]